MVLVCDFCFGKASENEVSSVKDTVVDRKAGRVMLSEMLLEIFCETVDASDICAKCLESLTGFYKFRQKMLKNLNLSALGKIKNFLKKIDEPTEIVTNGNILSIVPHSQRHRYKSQEANSSVHNENDSSNENFETVIVKQEAGAEEAFGSFEDYSQAADLMMESFDDNDEDDDDDEFTPFDYSKPASLKRKSSSTAAAGSSKKSKKADPLVTKKTSKVTTTKRKAKNDFKFRLGTLPFTKDDFKFLFSEDKNKLNARYMNRLRDLFVEHFKTSVSSNHSCVGVHKISIYCVCQVCKMKYKLTLRKITLDTPTPHFMVWGINGNICRCDKSQMLEANAQEEAQDDEEERDE